MIFKVVVLDGGEEGYKAEIPAVPGAPIVAENIRDLKVRASTAIAERLELDAVPDDPRCRVFLEWSEVEVIG